MNGVTKMGHRDRGVTAVCARLIRDKKCQTSIVELTEKSARTINSHAAVLAHVCQPLHRRMIVTPVKAKSADAAINAPVK